MRKELFNFTLPPELIAQHPAPARDGARLLVVDAKAGSLAHRSIQDLPDLIPAGTLCVPNDVKVRHAGAGAMVVDPSTGAALAELRIEANLDEGLRAVRVLKNGAGLDWDEVDRIGRLPLPPYITHLAEGEDEDRYQTVFHAAEGEAVAAPTAGLHFTPELIQALEARGCAWSPVRLHVGLGTFRPMSAEDTDEHVMHEERFEIPETTALELESTFRGRPRPVLAIGTTALRTLEGAWDGNRLARAGATRIFITPGYALRTADHLLTNFHLPESTLFVLVSALLGLDLAHAAYAEAIRERYRFFSYGDAMLILNARR